jgi:(S)-ureidoglycine---glyoxylate transaminase
LNETIAELNPPPRILMGPGPVGVDPRVLRAMSMPMLGQFDPAFTAYMNDTMELLRRLYRTANRWSFLVDGTARAGVEAILVSIIAPCAAGPRW